MAVSDTTARRAATARIRGRFAPSPTGRLHFGSLVAALASYLDARHRGGEWLVRIEDLDPPREVPGAAAEILRALEALGFEWDGAVRYQSRELARYAATLEHLVQKDAVYPCTCSRREIQDSAIQGVDAPIYPGTCRRGMPAGRIPRAWRVRTVEGVISFADRVHGVLHQDVAAAVGDFVLKRADNCFAYQLAVVLDDADQGITDVVRGADLLDSTARQIMLQRLLDLPEPAYMHVPVAMNRDGEKLSKQTFAAPLSVRNAQPMLLAALEFLRQTPPRDLAGARAPDILVWAAAHWDTQRIPRCRALPAPAHAQRAQRVTP